MKKHHPHPQRRVGQTVLVIVGVLGALAAFDGALLGAILLLAAGPAAYGGLLLIASAFVTVLGAAIAWTAYTLLTTGAERVAGRRNVQV
jgi:hypothetical protein